MEKAENKNETLSLVEENLKREWPLDADGFPHRKAARIVLINSLGQAYLIQGHDYFDLSHCWWFTVGGGLEPEEDLRDGALRELFEETGLRVEAERLAGPVLSRKATFHFARETRKQDELFFILRVSEAEQEVIDSGKGRALTALEKQVHDCEGWFSAAELVQLSQAGEKVYPTGFAQMLESWAISWDGVMREIAE
ncbi:NUDIX hydrolase [Arcanobacterium hippocoleae]|uniref:NUDIX hydrolase n=1 Tax=Arcanobacterium hippocoleae TaxID=149017 RepID=UPI00333FAA26